MDYCTVGLHTEIPWRKWTEFDVASIKVKREHLYDFDATSMETDDHYAYGRVGNYHDGDPWSYHTLFKPKPYTNFSSVDGADVLMTLGAWYTISKETINWSGMSRLSPDLYVLGEPTNGGIDYAKVTSATYDGINAWEHNGGGAPPRLDYSYGVNLRSCTQPPADPCDYCGLGPPPTAGCAYISEDHHSGYQFLLNMFSGAVKAYNWQTKFFTNGCILSNHRWYEDAGNWGFPVNGEHAIYSSGIEKLKVYYFNPVVNSISPAIYPTTGTDFEINGLGFALDDAWLNAYEWGTSNWKDHVWQIEFIGKQGQGTYTITTPVFPSLNWTITNTKITIPVAEMPNLPKGTYEIKLTKKNQPAIIPDAEAYAGDWRSYDSGEMYEGKRLQLWVDDDGGNSPELPDDPVIYSKWKWKSPTGEVDAWYAPIDVKCTDIFYDGRLLSLSPITRGISGSTGLYVSTEVTAILANTDMDISTKLAEYTLKNQVVQFWHGWQSEPEVWKEDLFKGYVYDYALEGDRFIVKLKDIFTKWFEKSIPEYTINLEDYPNAKENAVNQLMPEVLGYASYTTGEAPGAVEALCVDTTTYKYLASRGSLKEVVEVYADGTAIDSGVYTISYEDGGRTFITFDNDQGEKKITFNAKGYMHVDMNSANGYIQNPAYIILFVLGFIIGVPYEDIDIQSFVDLATLAENMSAEETGFFVLQYEKSAEQALAELLFTIGSYGYFKRDGKFAVLRKDISNFATEIMVFSQIDTIDNPRRSYNFTKFVNRIKGWWNKVVTANIFQSSTTEEHQSSIDFFEATVDNSKFELPWTTGEGVVNNRVNEELYRKAYGPWSVEFSLPINWLGKLDLLDNFRLQDPYGVSLTGAGEAGRYCFVDLTTIDAFGGSINIVAMDLAWILSQYCILGDETGIASNWNAVTFAQRMYCYLCDEITNEFADGMPGKILIDENII